jgi:acyl carrier protein
MLGFDFVETLRNRRQTMSDVGRRIEDVVARTLKVDIGRVVDEARFVEDLGAESIQSVELIAAFEEEFDIEMDEEAALAVKTVGHAKKFIENIL